MTDIIHTNELDTDVNTCSVCYENVDSVLECHVVCGACVEKHFKKECPVCRKKHTLPISGVPPVSLETLVPEKNSKPQTLSEIYAAMRKIQKEKEKISDGANDEENDSENTSEDMSQDISEDMSEEYDYDL